ncbi:MAG: hypothetical protein R3A46_12905 [Thermomicrobiales bacterium]
MTSFNESDRSGSGAGQPPDQDGIDPATAARRRDRLQRRISNLEYDIERASGAGQPGSRWRQRIDDVNAAIRQAESDAKELATPDQPESPIALPATPVADVSIQVEIPATIRFRIGDVSFRYSEEVDWTERGEQRSQPGLRRFEGDPDDLIPDDTPNDRRPALQEHLRHAIGALAIALRDRAESPADEITLADLATPCPVCGNWRDLRDRCITCQRRAWGAEEVRSQVGRLIDERNSLIEEMASQREALPILQRQLRDAVAELEKYQSG